MEGESAMRKDALRVCGIVVMMLVGSKGLHGAGL
jgi:hypothetical protein